MFTIDKSERETLSGEPTAEGVVTVPVADLKRLREQVTELQNDNTRLLNEARALRGSVEVKFTLVEGGKAPTKGTAGAAGWDLYARSGCLIAPGQTAVIPVGVRIELPRHHEAQVRGRSGLGSRGIFSHFGTIDEDYRGELAVFLFNSNNRNSHLVEAGDRVGQMVVARVEPIRLNEARELSETERGERGMGSTGR